MPAKKSLTQRSKEYLEKWGWVVGVVEQTIPHTFIKRDLFNMFDLIAICDGITMGVQVTSRSNVSARVKKIEDEPKLADVRKAGWKIIVQGWDQDKEGKWRIKEIDIS